MTARTVGKHHDCDDVVNSHDVIAIVAKRSCGAGGSARPRRRQGSRQRLG
jgi:hypothetical protein